MAFFLSLLFIVPSWPFLFFDYDLYLSINDFLIKGGISLCAVYGIYGRSLAISDEISRYVVSQKNFIDVKVMPPVMMLGMQIIKPWLRVLSIILFVIYKLNLFSFTGIYEDKIIFLLYAFLVVLIFNLFNQFFIGDSGAYSLSLFIGFLLIKIYSLNLGMSPYFIILLLWYPCFENLFSIIRKAVANKSILNPDNQHLHQYIFVFLKKKLILKSLNANIL